MEKGGRNSTEVLIDHLVAKDVGQTGPGRVLLPSPMSRSIQGAWNCGLAALRRAEFDGRVPVNARWAAADGYVGTVVCSGETRDETLAVGRREIERTKPRPPEPKEPNFPPELLAEFGYGKGPFLLIGPKLDAAPVEPSPENTPIVLFELAPIPDAPPPFGEWIRLLDDHGNSIHAVLIRDGRRGFTIVDVAWAHRINADDLDAILDAADVAHNALMAHVQHPPWPSSLPPLKTTAIGYVLTTTANGKIEANSKSKSQTPGFSEVMLLPDRIIGGAMRQRFDRSGDPD